METCRRRPTESGAGRGSGDLGCIFGLLEAGKTALKRAILAVKNRPLDFKGGWRRPEGALRQVTGKGQQYFAAKPLAAKGEEAMTLEDVLEFVVDKLELEAILAYRRYQEIAALLDTVQALLDAEKKIPQSRRHRGRAAALLDPARRRIRRPRRAGRRWKRPTGWEAGCPSSRPTDDETAATGSRYQ